MSSPITETNPTAATEEEGEGPMASRTLSLIDHTDAESGVLRPPSEEESVDTDDSFHSTVDVIDLGVAGGGAVGENVLYMSAMELVVRGGVQCRNIR